MKSDNNPPLTIVPQLAVDERLMPFVSDDRSRRFGMAVVVFAFLFFSVWAAWAPLARAVVAPGVVKVELGRRIVQHLEGGIVKEIHVQDGATVKEGDLLLSLDANQFRSDRDVVESQLRDKLIEAARLRAERDNLPEIPLPEGLDQKDPRVIESIANELSVFRARRNSHRSELKVLRERVRQAESLIEGLQEVNRRKSEVRASLETERSDLNKLFERNFISRHKILQAERQISELESEMAENSAKIASQRVQRRETELQVEFRNAEYVAQIVNALTEAEKRTDELRKKLLSLDDRYNRALVRAPTSGKVIGLKINTPGAVLSPGTHILDVVPEGANLQIEVSISPNDVDTVQLGQLADIRLSSLKAETTPIIEGKVVHLGGDRQVDEKTGLAYFESRVELTTAGIEELSRLDLRLQPGLPAEVIIKTGDRTMWQYIVKPLSNFTARVFHEK